MAYRVSAAICAKLAILMWLTASACAAAADEPDRAAEAIRAHDGTADGRAYRLLLPDGDAPAGGWPVVMAFHGAGDTHDNFADTLLTSDWGDAMRSERFALFVPAHDNAQRPSFLRLAGRKPAMGRMREAMGELLAVLDEHVATEHPSIDASRLTLLGFSEGAVFADLLAFEHEARVEALLLYAGAAAGKPVAAEGSLVVFAACGADDPFAAIARRGVAEWRTAGRRARIAIVEGVGHRFSTLQRAGVPPREAIRFLRAPAETATETEAEENEAEEAADDVDDPSNATDD